MSKMAKATAGGGGVSLPNDALSEILARLPVKSLLRFKSVCKVWYSLIKSPTFVSQHLHRPTIADAVSPVLFLSESVSVLSLTKEDTISVAALYEVPQPIVVDAVCYHWNIFGTFNGLVVIAPLLGCKDDIILWNPAMRGPQALLTPINRRI